MWQWIGALALLGGLVWGARRQWVRMAPERAKALRARAIRAAMESAMLAPKSEVSMYPWKDTKEKIPIAVRQVRTFMRAHRAAMA